MKNWKEEYDKIMGKGIDNMIKEQDEALKKEQARRDVKREDMDKHNEKIKGLEKEKKRLEELKPNIEKVEKIMKFRELAVKKIEEYYQVRDIRRKIWKDDKLLKEQDKIMEDTKKEIEALRNMLGSAKTADERVELNKKIGEQQKKQQLAFNTKNSLTSEKKSLGDQLKSHKYGLMKKEDWKKQVEALSSTIGKCDLACEALMEGKKITDIKFDKNVHRYTRPNNKKEKNNVKEETPKQPGIPTEFEDISSYTNPDDREPFVAQKDDEKTQGSNEQRSTFAQNHPKISNFFKRIKEVFSRKEALPEPKPQIKDAKPEVKSGAKPEVKSQDLTDREIETIANRILNDDNKMLEELASKGIEDKDFRDLVKVEVSNDAQKKLKELRVRAGRDEDKVGPKKTSEGLKKALRGDSEGR